MQSCDDVLMEPRKHALPLRLALSRRPETHLPSWSVPQSRSRGSYGVPEEGYTSTGRSTGSTIGRQGSGDAVSLGMKLSHPTICTMASKSVLTIKCETPLPPMTSGPPNCWLDS